MTYLGITPVDVARTQTPRYAFVSTHKPSTSRFRNHPTNTHHSILLDTFLNHQSHMHPSIMHSLLPLTQPPHSTKFLNFVISSSSSCKSASVILFDRLGISVFASSALSQHKLPSCDRSKSSNSVCDVSMRSTASIFSFCLKRANTSR